MKEVSEIVKIAHAMGVSVEAELGHVGQGDNYAVDGKTALTDPQEAKKYIEETGVDMLAVAVRSVLSPRSCGVPPKDCCAIPLLAPVRRQSGMRISKISRFVR